MDGLSIIIPCYNARDNIIRAIESIDSKELDTEIIIIEDCSVESSEDLICEYKEKSAKDIKYYKNEFNMGAGKTRNRAIKLATKNYIMFLDSDDALAENFFESVMDPIKNGYDEIVFDAIRVDEGISNNLNMFFSNEIIEGQIDIKDALVYIKGCTWGKIYKTSIIHENNIEFGSMPRNEDMVFTKVATSYAKNIFYIKDSLYIYYNNPASLMNNDNLITPQNAIDAFQIVKERLKNRGFEKELNSMYFVEILYSTTNSLISLGKSIYDIRINYRDKRKQYDCNDVYRKKYSRVLKISFILLELKLFSLYRFLRKKLR